MNEKNISWRGLLLGLALFGCAAFCLKEGGDAQKNLGRLPSAYEQATPKDLGPIAVLAALGDCRAAAADAAYIEALQYLGDPRNQAEDYRGTYDCYRQILWLDPYFHYAVLEGCADLVWGLHDLAKGRLLLEDAMRVDPKFARYRLYYAAMAYTQKGVDRDAMLQFLYSEVQKPDAPEMLLREVGNIYSKYGRPVDAMRYWYAVLQRAKEKQTIDLATEQLQKLLGHKI
jgi:tetratricopeptide (TPR) repeat protein